MQTEMENRANENRRNFLVGLGMSEQERRIAEDFWFSDRGAQTPIFDQPFDDNTAPPRVTWRSMEEQMHPARRRGIFERIREDGNRVTYGPGRFNIETINQAIENLYTQTRLTSNDFLSNIEGVTPIPITITAEQAEQGRWVSTDTNPSYSYVPDEAIWPAPKIDNVYEQSTKKVRVLFK